MRIVDNIRPDRQLVMFSATFPRQMEALARHILTKPIEVQVGGRSVVCKDVEQHVVSVSLQIRVFFFNFLKQAINNPRITDLVLFVGTIFWLIHAVA